LSWAAAWTSNWLTLSATNGLLAGGAQTNITVSINTNANTLARGSYMGTIGFMNQSNGLGNTTRSVSLSVLTPPAGLEVGPLTGLSSSGYVGGPFSPAGITYTLSNGGGSNLVWSASKSASWLTLSPSNGVLVGGASTNVVVTINTQANSLAASNYTDTVSFSNTSTGLGNANRPVNLTVLVNPPALLANPEALTNGSLAMTLQGVTNRVYSILGSTNLLEPLTNWSEVLRLTNTGGQIILTNPPPQYYRAKEL
jgi:Viral BACON domain